MQFKNSVIPEFCLFFFLLNIVLFKSLRNSKRHNKGRYIFFLNFQDFNLMNYKFIINCNFCLKVIKGQKRPLVYLRIKFLWATQIFFLEYFPCFQSIILQILASSLFLLMFVKIMNMNILDDLLEQSYNRSISSKL